MNFDSAIRELEEKRDFYNAAISALKKIAGHETAKAVRTNGSGRTHGNAGRPKSQETIERMRAAQRARHARIKAALTTTVSTPEPELVTQ